jgi:hypothetical protein
MHTQRYEERAARWAAEEARHERRFDAVAVARFFIAVGGVALAIAAFYQPSPMAIGLAAACAVAFIVLIRVHDRIETAREQARGLRRVNEAELALLAGELTDWPDGSAFGDPEHPYADDLDLFGAGSVFQYLNRAASQGGQATLAAWLLRPAPVALIEGRQEAAREMADDLDWRQTLQATGIDLADSEDRVLHDTTLRQWLQDPDAAHFPIPQPLLAVLAATTATAVVLTIMGKLAVVVPLLLLVVHRLLILAHAKRLRECYQRASVLSTHLGRYVGILETIEQARFQAPAFAELQGALTAGKIPASAHVARLAAIVNQLAIRHNPQMHLPLDTFLFWDFWWARHLRRWQQENGAQVDAWFDAVRRCEALASLGAAVFNHPDWCMPEVARAESFSLRATGLGHPLLPVDRCVRNDFSLERNDIAVITGANMAGKSTFQRAVALATVMAGAGAPVCASSLAVTPVRVFTSMRTRDSLLDNASTFYAELQRIRMILEAGDGDGPILFVLDELLRGTNSVDRQRGAAALLRQLHRQGHGAGLVATHDLELAELSLPGGGPSLYCFNSNVDGTSVTFDYQLCPGVCSAFNASTLMSQMGIDMADTPDDLPAD